MLEITITPPKELYNSMTNEFIQLSPKTLKLEHSLVSVSKWESKWKKPFLAERQKTDEELIDYVRCMTLTQNVEPILYNFLDGPTIKKIKEYIDDNHTATWFKEDNTKAKNKKIVTSEIIYYWMITLNIPVEFQKWHLGRLITLIRVCNEENKPPKKMSKKDVMRQNKSLNEQRRKAHAAKR